ncbi:MAG: hypothetical protein PWP15_595 [Methanothermococcus sp.]|jgi:hypothetical protein|uniref:hypothetical protein n=1 Tax=Methanothermococcus sp. TaxID=2614238 RepID=UPI00036800B7|nr:MULTISPECIES: hypothetical protein [Methanothermococcus]MDK2790088.1 hypothetical protein [Methanothermococcus sp.]MDK2987998.1 hypothetical protein [Methanothermococcus sp.]
MNIETLENENIEIVELPLPPGIPQSIIARLLDICNIEYEVKKDEILDKEYPILYGSPENIENAKKFIILFTETRLALRDIARLARRFKTTANLYTEDDELKYVLGIVANDVTNKDKIEILDSKPEGEFETIKICDKDLHVHIID